MKILSIPSILSRILADLYAARKRGDTPKVILLTHREMDELMSCRDVSRHVRHVYDFTARDLSITHIEVYRSGMPYRLLHSYSVEGVPVCPVDNPSEFTLTR